MYIPKGCFPFLMCLEWILTHTRRLDRAAKHLVCCSLDFAHQWEVEFNEGDNPRRGSPNTFTPERHLNADGKIAKDFSAPVFGSGR